MFDARLKERMATRKAHRRRDISVGEFNPARVLFRVEVELVADRKAVDPAVQKIMAKLRKAGCADGKEEVIELALSEALANAVVHGCKADPSKKVDCLLACDENHAILIVVRDEGDGFDPDEIPSPLLGENVCATRGRGIFLINQLMDEVRFHKNGTEIHMIKR